MPAHVPGCHGNTTEVTSSVVSTSSSVRHCITDKLGCRVRVRNRATLRQLFQIFLRIGRRRRFRIDRVVRCVGAHPLCGTLSRWGLNPIELAHSSQSAGWPAQLTVSAFNRPGLCANSPGSRAYCYAELTVSSPAMAVTITSTHYAYPQRDGQAELAWVAWLNTETAYPRTVTHLSTNLAQRRVTSLISPTTLPLSQTATLRIGNITKTGQYHHIALHEGIH